VTPWTEQRYATRFTGADLNSCAQQHPQIHELPAFCRDELALCVDGLALCVDGLGLRVDELTPYLLDLTGVCMRSSSQTQPTVQPCAADVALRRDEPIRRVKRSLLLPRQPYHASDTTCTNHQGTSHSEEPTCNVRELTVPIDRAKRQRVRCDLHRSRDDRMHRSPYPSIWWRNHILMHVRPGRVRSRPYSVRGSPAGSTTRP
jgi:hypothetical protein